MKKANVWGIVNNEAGNIIGAIEKGEIKTQKEFHDYLETAYNWKITDAIESIVGVYINLNGIEIPWDNDAEESA